MRGIEARRGDTPCFLYKAQMEMIRKLAEANSLERFRAKIAETLRVLGDYADELIGRHVDVEELLVTKRLSKAPSRYTHDVFQAIAAKQLEKAGFEVHPGQTVQYLIVNASSRRANDRVIAAQLLKPGTRYDAKEYVQLLVSAGETLLGVFGYTKSMIEAETLYHEKQVLLS
jgi:DNA polymerase elongation subunit (family B)